MNTTTQEWFPITNIHAISGVTLEQLWHQCHYLVWKFPQSRFLSEDQISDCCTDAAILVHKKMEEGKVTKFVYEEFKGYLFISLKNQVLKHNINMNLLEKSVLTSRTYDIDAKVEDSQKEDEILVHIEMDEDDKLTKELYEKGFSLLPTHKQQWLLQHYSGKPFKHIAKDEGLRVQLVRNVKEELRQIIMKLARQAGIEYLVKERRSVADMKAKAKIKEENKRQAMAYRESVAAEKKEAKALRTLAYQKTKSKGGRPRKVLPLPKNIIDIRSPTQLQLKVMEGKERKVVDAKAKPVVVKKPRMVVTPEDRKKYQMEYRKARKAKNILIKQQHKAIQEASIQEFMKAVPSDRLEAIQGLQGLGITNTRIAQILGINPSTLYDTLNPELMKKRSQRDKIRKAKKKEQPKIESQLPTTLADSILKLRQLGLSYNDIRKQLHCSMSTINFHCAEGAKAKNNARSRKNKAKKKLLNCMMQDRNQYFSQTQVCKKYKITPKQLQQLLADKKTPVVSKPVDLGEYSVTAKYIRCEDILQLNLEERLKK